MSPLPRLLHSCIIYSYVTVHVVVTVGVLMVVVLLVLLME